LCHLHHKLIGFYNRDEKCLLRSTDWAFKYSNLCFVFKRLTVCYWVVGESCDITAVHVVSFAGRSREMAVDWQENSWSTPLIIVIIVMLIRIIVLAIAYQCRCTPCHDHVAERSERSLVSLPSSYISTFHFHPAPFALPHHSTALITCVSNVHYH
jgi:hypothetical protein